MSEKELNIIVMGDAKCGKSSIILQYVKHIFLKVYDPTVEDYYRRRVKYKGNSYMLTITDTSGTIDLIDDKILQNADGFIFVYDVSHPQSFDSVYGFYQKVQTSLLMSDVNKNVSMIICANKIDLFFPGEFMRDQDELMSMRLGCKFFETSAKERINIDEMWDHLIEQIHFQKSIKHLSIEGKQQKTKFCSIL